MTRFLLLEQGEELSAENVAASITTAPVRVKLLAPAAPFREADVLHLRPPRTGRAGGERFVLYREGATFRLRTADEAPVEPSELVGVVTAMERGPLSLHVAGAPWRRLPSRGWPVVIDALEILRRVRHPLTPPLFQGSGAALLEGVRDKYDAPVETTQYAALATGELDEVEQALVREHVAPNGRILDIGCGGGREAVGFARLGYRVVGIDIAPRMVAASRRTAARVGVAAEFRVQSATALDDPPGTYDAAFFCGSLHHVPGRRLRIDTLRRIGRALAPAGVLLLMVVYRERRGWLSRSRLVDGARRVARALGAGAAVAEPGDGYMVEVSEGSDPSRPCFFHHYDRPHDVREELEAAGFTAQEARPGWWICRADGSLC
jgi:SAM-dependent methyltransferase